MLLVTFAVRLESRFFRRNSAEKGVRILHTGMGRDAAAEALRMELVDDRPTAVVSSGFAGGLDPNLCVGDVIADDGLSSEELLHQLPAGIRRGRIVTAATTVDSPEAKAKLHRETGAQAVDMETQAVAAECARAGLPLLVIRAISDAARDSIPVPIEVAWDFSAQRPRPAHLCLYLARNPNRIGGLVRFVRQTNLAARKLGATLDRVVSRPGFEEACVSRG
jgi:adenosylhomocysteine nucleosidase